MVERISTFSSTNRLITENLRLQSNLARTQLQLSTGLKSISYEGISRDTQRLLNLESSKEALKNYNVNGKLIKGNIDLQYKAIAEMIDLANSMKQMLVAANAGNSVNPNIIQNQATILLDEMAGLLNTQSAGRYLFSGSRIDVPPVDLTNPGWIAQTPPSVANTTYYDGDNVVLSTQLSETFVVDHGTLANDFGFENLLRGLNLAVNNPANIVALVEASGLIDTAIERMADMQARASTNSKSFEDQALRNEEDISVQDELISNIKDIDLAQTSVEQKNYETQLEAAYASSVKLLRLKLTDFL
jgi:flagellar hook-associated protein 3 FlgL